MEKQKYEELKRLARNNRLVYHHLVEYDADHLSESEMLHHLVVALVKENEILLEQTKKQGNANPVFILPKGTKLIE